VGAAPWRGAAGAARMGAMTRGIGVARDVGAGWP
jgi:hypothetical protein